MKTLKDLIKDRPLHFVKSGMKIKCIAKEIDLFNTPVDEVMTRNVIVIESHDTPEYCMQIMKQEKIRHMPVIEEQDLKGIISIRDLMMYDMKQKEEKIEMLNSYIQFNG